MIERKTEKRKNIVLRKKIKQEYFALVTVDYI